MRKVLSVLLSVTLIIIIFSVGTFCTSADAVPQNLIDQTSVKSYDFSSMMQLNDFFVCGPDNGRWGDWKVDNNVLKTVGNAGADWWGTNFLTQADYQNFKMEFDAVVSAGYGVFLRAEDDGKVANSGLNNWFSGNGYAILHYLPVEEKNKVLVTDFNGMTNEQEVLVENVLYEAGSMKQITGNRRVHWTVVCNGSDITFTIQDSNVETNKLTYTFTDTRYTVGHIGFYNLTREGTTSLEIDNLVITGAPVSERREPVWADDFSSDTSDSYTAYGSWQNNGVSVSGRNYSGKLGIDGVNSDWNYYYLKKMDFKDVTVDFDVDDFAGDSGSSYGLVLRSENPSGTIDGDLCYGVMFDGAYCTIGRMDGSWNQLENSGSKYYRPPDNTTIYHWRVVCEGTNICVYFNRSNIPAFSVNDDTFHLGFVGFRTNFAGSSVGHLTLDNLCVTGIRMGDVNEDNEVDICDLAMMEKYFMNPSTSLNESVAELTGNTDINSDDIIRLRKYLLDVVETVYDYNRI